MLGVAAQALNRTQWLVAGFFVLIWFGLVAILVVSPDVYTQTLRLVPGDARVVEGAFLSALSILIMVLVIGTLLRWRWTFWLILIAFLFGALRVPATIFQFVGFLPSTGPIWYETVQAIIGVGQLVVALAMLAGYRKAGAWADF
jgi:hypothetical protein